MVRKENQLAEDTIPRPGAGGSQPRDDKRPIQRSPSLFRTSLRVEARGGRPRERRCIGDIDVRKRNDTGARAPRRRLPFLGVIPYAWQRHRRRSGGSIASRLLRASVSRLLRCIGQHPQRGRLPGAARSEEARPRASARDEARPSTAATSPNRLDRFWLPGARHGAPELQLAPPVQCPPRTRPPFQLCDPLIDSPGLTRPASAAKYPQADGSPRRPGRTSSHGFHERAGDGYGNPLLGHWADPNTSFTTASDTDFRRRRAKTIRAFVSATRASQVSHPHH